MKVKLLKKIRKRYSITHYPNGYYIGGTWCDNEFTILDDSEDPWRYKINYSSKENAYKELVVLLREWIEEDYRISRKRKNNQKQKLWFNG